VTTVLVAGYLLSYVVVSADTSSTLAHVLTVFPLTAPFVLPARSALVGVPLWEHAAAVLLIVATIYALLRFAGRIYAQGLLHSGPRIPLRAAWRLGRQT
jgi:ABC-2 type transport system permease protein